MSLSSKRSRARGMAFLLLSGVLLNAGCGLIGVRYPVFIDNDPLAQPVRVVNVPSEQRLVLEDGREILLAEPVRELARKVEDSEHLVEVTPLPSPGEGPLRAHVALKEPVWYCGTPWAQLIRIPLFADRLPRWSRSPLSHGCEEQ